MRDDEMVLFVESDFGYSPMVKRKQPATGVRRKVIKQFAPPPDECTELAEARPVVKAFYLGTMDAGHKVDRLVKARKGTPTPSILLQFQLMVEHNLIINCRSRPSRILLRRFPLLPLPARIPLRPFPRLPQARKDHTDSWRFPSSARHSGSYHSRRPSIIP